MKLFSHKRQTPTVCCSIDCETMNALFEIAKQLKRLADAWEGDGGVTHTEDNECEDKYNRYWTDSDVDKVVSLYNEGKTIYEIAELFPGRTVNGVYCALKRRGISLTRSLKKNVDYPVVEKRKRVYKRKDMWTPEEDEKILAWVKVFGTKWTELSKALPGRTVEAIQARYRKKLEKK